MRRRGGRRRRAAAAALYDDGTVGATGGEFELQALIHGLTEIKGLSSQEAEQEYLSDPIYDQSEVEDLIQKLAKRRKIEEWNFH
ncbi:hypothetical protein ABVT39_014956 [Epinephelus coioides]